MNSTQTLALVRSWFAENEDATEFAARVVHVAIFQNGNGLKIRFSSITEAMAVGPITDALTTRCIPGGCRRLRGDELQQQTVRDSNLKIQRETQQKELGANKDTMSVVDSLVRLHGEGGQSKKRRRMARRLTDVVSRAQQVAASGLADARLEQEEDSDDENM